jgi:hypothetical protein
MQHSRGNKTVVNGFQHVVYYVIQFYVNNAMYLIYMEEDIMATVGGLIGAQSSSSMELFDAYLAEFVWRSWHYVVQYDSFQNKGNLNGFYNFRD